MLRKLLLYSAIAILIAMPVLALAQEVPVPIKGKAIGLGDIENAIQRIVQFAIDAAYLIILGFFIYAGFLWVTAGDNSAQVEKAKKTLKNAVIGAVVVFGVGVILNTIADFGTDPTQVLR